MVSVTSTLTDCTPEAPPRRDIREMIYRFLRDEGSYIFRDNYGSSNPEYLITYFINYCERYGINFGSPKYIEKTKYVESDPHYKEMLVKIQKELNIPEGADWLSYLKSIVEARDEAQENLHTAEQQLSKYKSQKEEEPNSCIWANDGAEKFCINHESYHN